MRTKNHFLLNLVSLVVVTGAVGLLAPTASWATLQCGAHVGPGESAFLFHDLNCSGDDPALTVEGPATLLMLGHKVDCQDPDAVGIQVIGQAAIVLQGTVTGCSVGIQVGGQGSHLIKEMTAKQNGVGFLLRGLSNGNSLTYNKAKSNRSGNFQSFGPSHDNEVSWNTSQGGALGITVLGDRNTVKYNTAKGYSERGFQLGGQDLTVTGNRALGGGVAERGFQIGYISGETSGIMTKNVAKGNSSGFFSFVNVSRLHVSQNTAKNNDIGISFAGTDSTLLSNTALDNSTFDLQDFNPNCDNNQWVSNRFRTSNAGCIQ